jgi:hypothetical protein
VEQYSGGECKAFQPSRAQRQPPSFGGALARKTQFLEAFQSDFTCPVPFEKILRFACRANHLYKPAPSRLTRGAARDRHGRRERDAVDAVRAADERAVLRTAKSCGPDAPMLALTRDNALHCAGMVTTSRLTRESAKETVKTIARGMPGVSGVTVVSNSCAFYFCTRGCGRSGRPAFPAPSVGRKFLYNSEVVASRECRYVFKVACHCERKRSNPVFPWAGLLRRLRSSQ